MLGRALGGVERDGSGGLLRQFILHGNLWTIARGAKWSANFTRRFCFLCSPGAALSSLSAALQCPSYPLSARRLIVCLLPLSWEFFANGRFLFVPLGGALPPLSFVPLFRSSLPSVARLRKLLKRYLTTPIQH